MQCADSCSSAGFITWAKPQCVHCGNCWSLIKSLNVRSDLLHVSCAMETLSTLKFAQRAKFIQNNVMNFLTSNCFCNCHLESDIFRRDLFSYFAISISMKAHFVQRDPTEHDEKECQL
jgi:hypothetical protein